MSETSVTSFKSLSVCDIFCLVSSPDCKGQDEGLSSSDYSHPCYHPGSCCGGEDNNQGIIFRCIIFISRERKNPLRNPPKQSLENPQRGNHPRGSHPRGSHPMGSPPKGSHQNHQSCPSNKKPTSRLSTGLRRILKQ